MGADIQLLKQLREMTFAPLKDCKEALAESGGDLEKAQEFLRKKGIAKAGDKADRETKEGLVILETRGDWTVGLKLLCETDFVAKNEKFQELFANIQNTLFSLAKPIANKEALDEAAQQQITDYITDFVGRLGENTKLGEVLVTDQKAYIYNHPGNKVASLIYFSEGNEDTAKELALQVAAMTPLYLSFDEIPADSKEKLAEEFRAELVASGKPENMIDQIVQGKITKALAENVLLEQEYIRDAGKKVKDIIPADFHIKGFARLAIG